MRLNALTVGIAAIALSLTAACGSNDAPTVIGPVTTATPSQRATTATTPTPTSTPTSSGPSKEFATGQCLVDRPDYVPIPCESAHTYEVVALIPNSDNATNLLKRSAMGTALCTQAGADYLGSGGWVATRLDVSPMPTAADPQNASRYVCVASEYTPDLKRRATALTGLLKGKLSGDGFYDYAVCMEQRASQTDDLKAVSCSSPHQSEAVGGRLSGKPGQAFPGESVIAPAALTYCTPVGHTFLGVSTRSDVVVTQNSSGAGPWARGNMITGCFVEVTSGTVKKSLRGIGSTSLESYR